MSITASPPRKDVRMAATSFSRMDWPSSMPAVTCTVLSGVNSTCLTRPIRMPLFLIGVSLLTPGARERGSRRRNGV